jgi:hypothetical protein
MLADAAETLGPHVKVAGLVLTPGASTGRDQSTLVAIDDALTPAGV